MSKKIEEALKIAIKELRSNYGEYGIYAGPKKHRQYWARDSFITSFGTCALGDFEQVKKVLNTFILFQREDGHIPARVEDNYHFLTLLGIKLKRKKLVALHRQTQPWASDVVDSNSWFIISAHNFIKMSNDKSWLKKNLNALIKAAHWLTKKVNNNHLVTEGYTSNWSDCNFVSGNTSYNNVLAWKAFVCMSELADGSGKEKFKKLADSIKESINQLMWDNNNGYFIHYIGPKGFKHNEFYSDGNLLAISWGFATKEQATRIYQYMDTNLGEYEVPTGYPRLIWWDNLVNSLVFPMYKTENIFTLWQGMYALSKTNSGDSKKALGMLERMAKTIVEYKTCHEVLTPDNQPVNLWFYKSEGGISWTASMFIYVCTNLEGASRVPTRFMSML